MSTTIKSFATLLCTHRKSLGMTQEQLAAQWNYSKETISSWERGKRSPSTRDLPRLAHLFGMDQEELFHYMVNKDPEFFSEKRSRLGDAFDLWGELQHIYRSRTDFNRDFSYPKMIEQAKYLLAVGLSLNAIALNYNREQMIDALVQRGCQYDLCFLDPDGTFCSVREQEEGYTTGILSDLTRLNINNVRAIQQFIKKVAPPCSDHLQIRLYDLPPRMNIYIVDDTLMAVQFYLYGRGEDTPTFVLKRQTDRGLFDYYASAARCVFEQARPIE